MNIVRVGANPFVVLSRAVTPNATPPCSNHSFSPLMKLQYYYSAVRMAPLPPCGSAKFKEGEPSHEKEQHDDMVLNVLSEQADAALELLSKMSVSEEDMAAKAHLENDLSTLAADARKGALRKPECVRYFISGVYRLIELACRLYPSAPWGPDVPSTEEEFVHKYMDAVTPSRHPRSQWAMAAITEMEFVDVNMYPGLVESDIDLDYIKSIRISMDVAEDLVNAIIMNNTPRQLEILNMLRGSMDGHQFPSTPEED